MLIIIALQTSPVQNWLAGIATKKLSKALGTEVSIKHVSIGFFNRLDMEGTMIRDRQKDTLLYAGHLKVRITDWFFFKDKIDLKYIGLEDAVIKLQRKDSVWNYQHIVDYFASPTPTKKDKKAVELNLQKVDFKNVHFLQNDLWVGQQMDVRVGSLTLDADKVNFDKKELLLKEVTVDKPVFSLIDMQGLRPDSLKPKKGNYAKDTSLRFNTGDLLVKVGKLAITNGTFINIGNNRPADPYFDAGHMYVTKINARFDSLSLVKDTLITAMNISCKERCGFDLKKLKTQLKITPQIMEFARLDLQTNNSKLGNYYAMKFNHFNDDFADYETNVTMVARFINSRVTSDDVAFFATDLKEWKKQIDISGDFRGTVANFNIQRLTARTGATTIYGTLAMKGLPDIDKTLINFNDGGFQTNYKDLTIFAPPVKEVRNPDLAAMGKIVFKGSFNGYVSDFVTKGNIATDLGMLRADIAMKFPAKADASYRGSLTATNFHLGKFVHSSELGLINFDGRITGSSFNMDRLKTTLDGTIKSLQFNDYTYTNITTNGTFQKKYFTGEVAIDDPNLTFTSSVEVDLSKEQPRYNMFGDIVKSDLKKLKILKDSIEVTGTLDVNFTGTNIDNFLGQAHLLNAIIKGKDIDIRFDSLNLTSNYYRDTIKYLRLATNDFNVTVWGEYNILGLPNSFQSFLHRYYPAYINEPSSVPPNQNFGVMVNTHYVEPYLKLFDKKLEGLNDARLRGTVNTQSKLFTADISIPYVKYDQYSLTGTALKGTGTQDSLTLTGEIASVHLSDSFYLPSTTLNIISSNNNSVVSVKTSANNTLNDASLVASVETLEDGVRVNFQPSSFVLNNKQWNIEKEGEIVVRKNFVSVNKLKFTQGFQEINIQTEEIEGSSMKNVNVDLKNIVIGDIVSPFLKKPKLEGLASGKITLSDFFGNFTAKAELKAEQFHMNEDSLGLVNVNANYTAKKGDIEWDIQSPNEKYKFNAKGTYSLKDTADGNPLKADMVLDNTRLTLIQQYLDGIFSNVDGFATGTLKVKGGKSVNFLGDVMVRNAGMRVDYTQVYYYIDSALIKFEEDGINFGQFTIRDTLNRGNTGSVKGKLYEKDFKDMVFDFDLATNKLLLLNTQPKDNNQFYGKAIGKATLSLKGPQSNAKMTIVGEANDSSHIFIPSSTSKESGDADFIVFKQFGEEMIAGAPEEDFKMAVDLDLTANNNVKIDVILDELTGDVIHATGDGRLRIKASTTGELDMRGKYNIDKGDYSFNFQSIIRKPFTLLPNAGNYIQWTGDPFEADIRIDAQYEAENVSLNDLISGQSSFTASDNSLRAYRDKVYVIAQLRNKLSHPDIKFKIDFPQSSTVKNDPNFAQFLSRIENDQNEMLTQATSLIVFNSFTPYGQGFFGSGRGINASSLGINTISQKITAEINKQVSNVLYKVFKDPTLHFDVGTSVYQSSNLLTGGGVTSSSNGRIDRQTINLKVAKGFFDNNVIVTFGSDFDFNVGASVVQSGNFQWLPDINVEIILSRNKNLRAIVFSKNSLDISGSGSALGRRNRQGVSISYRTDFDVIPLFGKRPEKSPAIKPEEPVYEEFKQPTTSGK